MKFSITITFALTCFLAVSVDSATITTDRNHTAATRILSMFRQIASTASELDQTLSKYFEFEFHTINYV